MGEVYSLMTGMLKSLKNTTVVLGGAALMYLIETRLQWLPEDYKWMDAVIGGLLTYLGYNAVKFSNKK